MRILTPAEIQPVVRIANYHPVLPAQSWGRRCIPDVQLIFVVRGLYAYESDGQTAVSIQPGEVLFIEPGHRHTFRRVDGKGMGTITGVHCEFTANGSWAAGDYRLATTPERITTVADVDYLHSRFQRLANVYSSYVPNRELQTSTITREIVLILASHWGQPASPEISPRVQEMIKFIRANLRQRLSRRDLAGAFGVSPEYVNQLFRRELGMTPTAVINRERAMVAYRLLHEQGCSVKEAAHAVGYTDAFYFSRVFRAIFGVPPSQVV